MPTPKKVNKPNQLLVNDPKCEELVLSILLTNEHLYAETAEILSPEMFYNPKNALIYKAIAQVFSQGEMKFRTEAANIMKAIDPSMSSRYDEMLQNKGM